MNVSILLVLGLLFTGQSPAPSQETVRLKNGKYVSGEIRIDDSRPEGFTIVDVLRGGTFFIRWDQIPLTEKNRLLGAPDTGPQPKQLLDGIAVLTPTRFVEGILSQSEEDILYVKTSKYVQPIPIPQKAIVEKRAIRIPESEVFTPDERINRRLSAGDPEDADSLLMIGKFAVTVERYDRARALYDEAGKRDPGLKREIKKLLFNVDILVRERDARLAVEEITDLIDRAEFKAARKAALEFFTQYAGTDAAGANGDLPEMIEQEAEQYRLKRAEFLARRVPFQWVSWRKKLLTKYATSRYTFEEARDSIARLDHEIESRLAARYRSAPPLIREAWKSRRKRPRTIGYGSGTWLSVKEVPDGGLDYDQGNDQKAAQTKSSGVGIGIPILDAAGRIWYVIVDDTPPAPKPLGRPLIDRETWWSLVSFEMRRVWLEADYARSSRRVRIEEETKTRCRLCLGFGLLRAKRHGRTLIVTCARCHGAKSDISVRYW